MKPFQVVVGNIGTVYEGNNYKKAWREYREAVALSTAPHGRASGESVTFFHNGETRAEFAGTNSNNEE